MKKLIDNLLISTSTFLLVSTALSNPIRAAHVTGNMSFHTTDTTTPLDPEPYIGKYVFKVDHISIDGNPRIRITQKSGPLESGTDGASVTLPITVDSNGHKTFNVDATYINADGSDGPLGRFIGSFSNNRLDFTFQSDPRDTWKFKTTPESSLGLIALSSIIGIALLTKNRSKS
jgi:hypothetical protein